MYSYLSLREFREFSIQVKKIDFMHSYLSLRAFREFSIQVKKIDFMDSYHSLRTFREFSIRVYFLKFRRLTSCILISLYLNLGNFLFVFTS